MFGFLMVIVSPQSGFWGLFLFLKLNYMPTIDIPDKICPHCGGIRWVTYQKTKTLASGESKTYVFYKCAKKNIETGNKWRKNHIEHHRKTAREYVKEKRKTCEKFRNSCLDKKKVYYQKNKEYLDNYRRQWTLSNIEKEREYSRRCASKNCVNLSYSYLRGTLSQYLGIKRENLSKDSINKYKTYLLAYRQLKQLQK